MGYTFLVGVVQCVSHLRRDRRDAGSRGTGAEREMQGGFLGSLSRNQTAQQESEGTNEPGVVTDYFPFSAFATSTA